LIAAAGLDASKLPADPAAARRVLYRGPRLRELGAGPVAFARSGVMSPVGLLRLGLEPIIPAHRNGDDESVWDFAQRRRGAVAAEALVGPLSLGILAGTARRQWLPAAFPAMARLEREHGSLIRGLIARRGKTSAGPLTSFRDGLQSLPRALAARGQFRVRRGAAVSAVMHDASGWRVAVAGNSEAIPADAVVLAAEPWAAGPLLAPLDAAAAADLSGISCPPVAVVGLGFTMDDAPRVPRGFGALIARGEGLRLLGTLWDSHLYAGRSPRGHLLVRSMFGGAVDPGAGLLSEAELVALATDELARLFGITAAPRFVHVVRWPRAIPQYELGHLDRVARIERAVARQPGLFITGNALHGVSFADAAVDGLRCGERAAKWLAPTALRYEVATPK
ncbi:MAG: protoporphyrinogen oxidase, partial [Gemmatimonadales bacterium]